MCRGGACVCGPTGKQLIGNRLFITAGFLYIPAVSNTKVSPKNISQIGYVLICVNFI